MKFPTMWKILHPHPGYPYFVRSQDVTDNGSFQEKAPAEKVLFFFFKQEIFYPINPDFLK